MLTTAETAAPAQARGFGLRYGAAVFLGAFLLFLVQPLLAKAILPWFGGVPAVWTTCLLFFQGMLLAGYLYAHLLSRLAPRRQIVVHCGLLLASLAFVNILPSDWWRPSGPERPALRILALLAANIGFPYLLLAATGPLLQSWYGTAAPGASPYRLYALSNAGSLLALLAYPFLLEPLLALRQQGLAWGALYLLFAWACAWCALPLKAAAAPAGAAAAEGPPPGAGEKIAWTLLAGCGTLLLMAVTAQLTQDVAAVPFLWLLPLALYLLSFIFSFAGDRWYNRRNWAVYLAFACAGAAYMAWRGVDAPLVMQVTVYNLALFIACMFCHGELARRRPAPGRLTGFYLLVAAGGAAGGLLAAVGAPLLLDGPWEYHLAWLAAASLALYLYAGRLFGSARGAAAWLVLLALYGGLAYSLYGHYSREREGRLAMGRNFYGTLNVYESYCGDAPVLIMMHGQIEHGFQFAEGHPLRQRPVSYYAPETGAGAAVNGLRELQGKKPLSAGFVGLGAGIMAAWGRPGDKFVFYEINPLVARLAREYFTYLAASPAEISLALGDARLTLEREALAGAAPLDLLVLDAFTGDSIPLHLLTAEAFELYFKRLRPGGVLAVHVSNRFVGLVPLVRGLAARAGKMAAFVESWDDEAAGTAGSEWILITADGRFYDGKAVRPMLARWPAGPKPLVFTDQRSNLLLLLKLAWPVE